MGRPTLTLRCVVRVGLRARAAAVASSNGSQASPIIERGWDLFETVSGPAPGTVFDFDDAGPMAPIPFTGVPLRSFDFTTGTDGDFATGIGVRGTGTADTIVKRLDVAEPGIDKTDPPGPIIPEAGRVDLEMAALRFMSVDVVDLDPGPAVDEHFLFVTLQSERDPALTSTGEMTIDGLTSEAIRTDFSSRSSSCSSISGSMISSGPSSFRELSFSKPAAYRGATFHHPARSRFAV